jgi:exodeoxyribonuclease VII large subunit
MKLSLLGSLINRLKKLLEQQFRGVSVLGEISNIARPSSGHIYFTLKDEDGAIRCAMFRNQNLRLNFDPQNGDQCILKGSSKSLCPSWRLSIDRQLNAACRSGKS